MTSTDKPISETPMPVTRAKPLSNLEMLADIFKEVLQTSSISKENLSKLDDSFAYYTLLIKMELSKGILTPPSPPTPSPITPTSPQQPINVTVDVNISDTVPMQLYREKQRQVTRLRRFIKREEEVLEHYVDKFDKINELTAECKFGFGDPTIVSKIDDLLNSPDNKFKDTGDSPIPTPPKESTPTPSTPTNDDDDGVPF